MKLNIDATEVWDELQECKVGDRKVLEFTVTGKGADVVRGNATHVEYAEESEGEYEESTEEMPDKKDRKGVPKAIVMISKE